MFKNSIAVRLLGAALIALFAAGCLISGTFVIVESFDPDNTNQFFFYRVDITQEPDWAEHRDDIDKIDAVGVDFKITSTAAAPVTFCVYVDTATTGADLTDVPDSASVILESLVVNTGTTHITYAQSLGLIRNLDRLKKLTKLGKFDMFGTNTAGAGEFNVDSGKVIVTFSAGE